MRKKWLVLGRVNGGWLGSGWGWLGGCERERWPTAKVDGQLRAATPPSPPCSSLPAPPSQRQTKPGESALMRSSSSLIIWELLLLIVSASRRIATSGVAKWESVGVAGDGGAQGDPSWGDWARLRDPEHGEDPHKEQVCSLLVFQNTLTVTWCQPSMVLEQYLHPFILHL